jgi:hypothetical protein
MSYFIDDICHLLLDLSDICERLEYTGYQLNTFEYEVKYLGYLCNILGVHSIHLNMMQNIWDICIIYRMSIPYI